MSQDAEGRRSKSHSLESVNHSGMSKITSHIPKITKQNTAASDDAVLTRNQECHGLLGSLMSAAHNAANIINSKRDSYVESDPEKIDWEESRLTGPAHGADPDLRSFRVSPNPSIAAPNDHLSQASNVHFEPIHDSPVNTLGNGDLTLSHFESKAAKSGRRCRQVNSGKDKRQLATQKPILSGTDDSKVISKNPISHQSTADSEHTLASEDAEYHEDFDPDYLSNIETDNAAESSTLEEPNSKKRKEFRSSFKNVPASEELLAEYSCAFSKDILIHGKLYLTKNLICFKSNILGWVTNLIIPIQEVIQIEKKSTAVLFPNGMIIKTLYQKYVFASFLSRDSAFGLITKVWNEALRNNRIDNSARLQKKNDLLPIDSSESHASTREESISESGSTSEDESQSGSDGGHDLSLLKKLRNKRRNSNKASDSEKETDSQSIDSKQETPAKKPDGSENSPSQSNSNNKVGLFKGFRNPGPAMHKPTNPSYPKDHVHIMDQTFKAPLGVVFSLLYGPDNTTFVKILESSKNFDIEKKNITELNSDNKERSYTYIKPLSSSIGPKQTKCVITETLLEFDFDNFCEVEQVTQTPDVPSGGSFKVKTKQFFSWGPDNTTVLSVYTNIEWSSKSWIKGAIEKGSLDGQKASMKDMSDTLHETLNSGASFGSKRKRKKSKSVGKQTASEVNTEKEPMQPTTIMSQISNLIESIGGSIPLDLGFLGNKGLGLFALVIFLFLYSYLLLRLGGGKVKVVTESGAPSTVRLNNNRYYLTPTIDTKLHSNEGRSSSSAELWEWILSRTGELDSTHKSMSSSEGTSDHYKEILRLTKKKIDEAYSEIL